MGLHNESANARYSPLEGEMRRRLWWSLIMFDNRICELSDQRASMLVPAWDCRTPLNMNDFDLRPEMKIPPLDHDNPTEALFVVLRSELGDFIRHCDSHLDFTNPILKPLAQLWRESRHLEGAEFTTFETALEDKYLRHCNPENPLHFMTLWTVRGYLAKCRLMEHHLRYSSAEQTDSQYNTAISHALRMLECDTKLVASPLTKGYQWMLNSYFPLPAYLHIVQDIRRRPLTDHAARGWKVMSENYHVRLGDPKQYSPLFGLFSRIILQAWEECRSGSKKDQPVEPPTIVADIQRKLAERSKEQHSDPEQRQGEVSRPSENFPMPMPMGIDGNMPFFGMDEQSSLGSNFDMTVQPTMDFDLGLLDWSTTNWHPTHFPG